jgi:1,6-anhydro-N-acetylmuramate kinase
MHLTSRILAVREAGAGAPGETWQYTAITRAKNIGGVISVSPPSITSFLDTPEPVVTFTSGVGTVLIDLIGAANKTIHWVSKSEMIIVSHSP